MYLLCDMVASGLKIMVLSWMVSALGAGPCDCHCDSIMPAYRGKHSGNIIGQKDSEQTATQNVNCQGVPVELRGT